MSGAVVKEEEREEDRWAKKEEEERSRGLSEDSSVRLTWKTWMLAEAGSEGVFLWED